MDTRLRQVWAPDDWETGGDSTGGGSRRAQVCWELSLGPCGQEGGTPVQELLESGSLHCRLCAEIPVCSSGKSCAVTLQPARHLQ